MHLNSLAVLYDRLNGGTTSIVTQGEQETKGKLATITRSAQYCISGQPS